MVEQIVQDRQTGSLQEEKMASYVRLGMRVIYRGIGTGGGIEGERGTSSRCSFLFLSHLFEADFPLPIQFDVSSSPSRTSKVSSTMLLHLYEISNLSSSSTTSISMKCWTPSHLSVRLTFHSISLTEVETNARENRLQKPSTSSFTANSNLMRDL